MNLMKPTSLTASLALITCLLTGCTKESAVPPAQYLVNPGAELGSASPSTWWYGLSGNFSMNWSDTESHSSNNSLKISTAAANSTDFAFWGQTITKNLPIGKSLTLKVKIKSNLVGRGAAISIRTENSASSTSAAQVATTEGNTSITGTFDWQEYSVNIANVGPDTKSIFVYLMMLPGTIGSVCFDDMSLTD